MLLIFNQYFCGLKFEKNAIFSVKYLVKKVMIGEGGGQNSRKMGDINMQEEEKFQ